MADNYIHALAVRFARAYIGYIMGVSDTTMAKQIPDDAEVGEYWISVATSVIATVREQNDSQTKTQVA